MNNTIWIKYQTVNEALKSEFLCIPPYRCVTEKFVEDCYLQIDTGKPLRPFVANAVMNPSQRAYQFEYRYRKAEIFQSVMTVLEYATLSAMQGNNACAYLSFLPIIEALMRKWAIINPVLTFNKMAGFAPQIINYLKKKLKVFQDERTAIINWHIEFLHYMLSKVIFLDFDLYKESEFKDIFNRNLALHKLEGVSDWRMCKDNTTRIVLLIDIIAELFLMQSPNEWWDITFNATPEINLDFQLRWHLYMKYHMMEVGPNDLCTIENAFLNHAPDNMKEDTLSTLKAEICIAQQLLKSEH